MMPNDSAGQGACAAFFSLLFSAAQNGTLLKLILTEPRVPGEKKGIGRLCRMKDGLCLQVEIFHEDGKATHENFPLSHSSVSEAQTAFAACFSPVLPARFARAHLLTSAGEAELRPNRRGAYVLLGGEKLSRALGAAAAPAVPPVPVHVAGNDREKSISSPAGSPFWSGWALRTGKGTFLTKKGRNSGRSTAFWNWCGIRSPLCQRGRSASAIFAAEKAIFPLPFITILPTFSAMKWK